MHELALSKPMNDAFDFGNGPVPAHRHINRDGSPGGWVADTASVSDTAWIGRDARVSGGEVVGGRVAGDALVYGGEVSGDALVSGGRVSGGRVSGGIVTGGHVAGHALVSGGVVSGGHVSGGVVSGDALVSGGRVSGGRVTITPIVLTGFEYTVTITDMHVQIGCECWPIRDFATAEPPVGEEVPHLLAAQSHINALALAHAEHAQATAASTAAPAETTTRKQSNGT